MKEPTEREVHIWRGFALAQSPIDVLALLSSDERARYERIRNSDERVRFCSAHVALRRIFADYLHVEARSIGFARSSCPRCHESSHGRPVLDWPKTDLAFSLSHSGNQWLVAVTSRGVIGADLECAADPDLILAIREVLTSREQQRFDQLQSEDARRRFLLRAWTRKEAVCKALGVGLVADIQRLEVEPWREGPVQVAFGIAENDAIAWDLVDIPVGADVFAAVARPQGLGIQLVLHPVNAYA